MAKKTPIQYKGYTINYINGEYRADAYSNPQFTNTNLAKLKKEINQYLRDESKGGSTYADGGEIRTMALHDSVIYKDKTWYVTKKNGEVGLTNFTQGAWGFDYPFVPLTKIIQDNELTDMYGNKVFIPYSLSKAI